MNYQITPGVAVQKLAVQVPSPRALQPKFPFPGPLAPRAPHVMSRRSGHSSATTATPHPEIRRDRPRSTTPSSKRIQWAEEPWGYGMGMMAFLDCDTCFLGGEKRWRIETWFQIQFNSRIGDEVTIRTEEFCSQN